MDMRHVLGGTALLLFAASGALYLRHQAAAPSAPVASTTSQPAAAASRQPDAKAASEQSAQSEAKAADTFAVDGAGQLVLNRDTRTRIEQLLERNDAEHLPAVKQELVRALPRDAAEQVAELLDRYQDYQVAARELYSPRSGEPTAEEQLDMLENLHVLRVEHLGVDAAEAFFGSDEADARNRISRRETVPDLVAPTEAVPEDTDPNVAVPPE